MKKQEQLTMDKLRTYANYHNLRYAIHQCLMGDTRYDIGNLFDRFKKVADEYERYYPIDDGRRR